MQMAPRPDLGRAILRLAAAAALIAFVIPLLPVYGVVGERLAFVFSLGLPLRGVIQFFLVHWNSAIVVTVGILFLRRDHVGVAGGAFAAVAIGLTITIAAQIVVTAPHFGRWQTVVILMLEILQAILLVLASSRAIGASRGDERRSAPAANEGPTEG